MVYYNGQHSITFINPLCGSIEKGLYPERIYTRNTWKDWHLMPTNKPIISSPKRKTYMVENFREDGSKDISLDYFKRPQFSNREGSISFIIVDNNLRESIKDSFNDIYYKMNAFFSFGKTYMILDDEKDFYYEGYFSIDETKSDKNYSTITISYSLFPYKWKLNSSFESWLWDPFDLKYGIIKSSLTAANDQKQSFLMKYNESGNNSYSQSLYYNVRLGSLIRIVLELRNDLNFTLRSMVYNTPNGETGAQYYNDWDVSIIPNKLKSGKNIFYYYVTPDSGTTSAFTSLKYNNIFSDLHITLSMTAIEGTDNQCTIYIEEGCI